MLLADPAAGSLLSAVRYVNNLQTATRVHLEFMAGAEGFRSYTLMVVSDSYVGLEIQEILKVQPASVALTWLLCDLECLLVPLLIGRSRSELARKKKRLFGSWTRKRKRQKRTQVTRRTRAAMPPTRLRATAIRMLAKTSSARLCLCDLSFCSCYG